MTDAAERKLPEPGPEHRKLNVFLGNWRAQGESYAEGQRADNPRASAALWTSDESYEWLPGGFFLLHRWDAKAGTRVFQGTETLGYDAAMGAYFTRFFDNAGFHPEYHGESDGDIWTFREPSTRATIEFTQDGNMTVKWEWATGGRDWLPLCERVAKRL